MIENRCQIYEFVDFRLDLKERLLTRDGRPVALTPRAFEVLVRLVERRGHLVEKDELMRDIWADSIVEEANLSRTVWMLRKALSDDRNGHGVIQTVPKYGYRFVAAVSEVSNSAASATTGIGSLAVLPLRNVSGNAAQEYLANGVGESLIAELSRAKGLRIIAPKATLAYRETSKTPEEIARELGVEAIVRGSFVKDGERVEISLELIEAATSVKLWSVTCSRDWCGIFYLQSDLAKTIAEKLRLELRPADNGTVGVLPEAFDLYLRARFHLLRETKEDTAEAITLLEDAVKFDPQFSRAFAELARAYNLNAFYFAAEEKKWSEKAFIAVERANILNPDLPEVHLGRGLLLWTHACGFRHDEAIAEYKRALELNPNYDEARHQLGLVYHHVGLFQQSAAEYQLALAINPTNNLIRAHLAGAANFQNRVEQSLAILNTLSNDLSLVVSFQVIWCLYRLGKFDEAAEAARSRLSSNPRDEGGLITGLQALLASRAGDEKTAIQKIEQAIKLGTGFGHFHHCTYFLAESYALLKNPDQAMRWLQFTADDGFPCYPLFENDPDLDGIREDPRFVHFLSKQRDQWEQRSKIY